MNPTTSLTLLIAAHESSQAAALTEMIQSLRPEIRVASFGEQQGEDEHPAGLELAMVVERVEELGELSRRVRAQHPNAQLVMIAPRFDESAIAVAGEVEAAAIIPSPCEPAAVLRVLRAREAKVGFSGRCRGVHTSELLRLHAQAGSDGILHLTAGERAGAIYLEDGQPVHAHCNGLRGADAVPELLRWTDAKAAWIDGRAAGTRTIVGRIEGLLEREIDEHRANRELIDQAPRDVLRRLEHLATIQDILGVYLLRDTEIVTGHGDSSLDEAVIGRALSRLARVFHDMEEQQGDRAGGEIQATVGDHRLVVDRIGPARLGFQIGVIVRQATPICKSLRRLLRQIDRSFRRSLAAARQQQAVAPSGIGKQTLDSSPAADLHQVARAG